MSERSDAIEGVADVKAGPEITNVFAGVPVSDLDASVDGYTRLFGRPPDRRAGNATQAGAGRITLAVTGLDAL
jgi:hypothetical protein